MPGMRKPQEEGPRRPNDPRFGSNPSTTSSPGVGSKAAYRTPPSLESARRSKSPAQQSGWAPNRTRNGAHRAAAAGTPFIFPDEATGAEGNLPEASGNQVN